MTTKIANELLLIDNIQPQQQSILNRQREKEEEVTIGKSPSFLFFNCNID